MAMNGLMVKGIVDHLNEAFHQHWLRLMVTAYLTDVWRYNQQRVNGSPGVPVLISASFPYNVVGELLGTA